MLRRHGHFHRAGEDLLALVLAEGAAETPSDDEALVLGLRADDAALILDPRVDERRADERRERSDRLREADVTS